MPGTDASPFMAPETITKTAKQLEKEMDFSSSSWKQNTHGLTPQENKMENPRKHIWKLLFSMFVLWKRLHF